MGAPVVGPNAYHQGYLVAARARSYGATLALERCPHPTGTSAERVWYEGWNDCERDRALASLNRVRPRPAII